MESYERNAVFPNGMQFRETYWKWLGVAPEVAHQVGPTCSYHTLANVLEYHYRIWYHNNKLPLPFDRLSVQYLYDRTLTMINDHPKDTRLHKILATDLIRDEGIMPVEHYCVPYGLRGEYNWLPFFLIDENRRYLIRANGTWIEMQDPANPMTPEEKFDYIVTLLKNGPVYADFFPNLLNGEYDGNRGEPHGFLNPTPESEEFKKTPSHSIMLVGHGSYNVRDNEWARYFIYLNTYSVFWGDKGYGRIHADGMKGIYSVWFPTIIVPPVNPSTSGPSTSGRS